jgi:hypothetical protein
LISMFTLPCSLLKHRSFAMFVKQVSLIIWDECLMQHCFGFKAVN